MYQPLLWELTNKGIYTIKFVTSPKEAKSSARQRAILEGSNRYIDECYEIDLDRENQDKLCCNLIIRGSTNRNDEIYREAEQYILRAKTVFYYNRQNIILGQNYFKK